MRTIDKRMSESLISGSIKRGLRQELGTAIMDFEMDTPVAAKDECATPSQKEAAFFSLQPEEFGKLLTAAAYMARKFKGKVNYADDQDLLQEALFRVLGDRNTRKWYPEKVTFVVFLIGCMRSIASGWGKKARTTELLEDPVSPERHDAQTEATIMLEKISLILITRPHASKIFELKCQGLTAKQIQRLLCLDKHVYDAAVKWIHRTLRKEGLL
jgi:DNA-directed RNA polymerase specialized sigma24 family protein